MRTSRNSISGSPLQDGKAIATSSTTAAASAGWLKKRPKLSTAPRTLSASSTRPEFAVKTAFERLGVAVLLVSFGFSAYGQGLPLGSYQQSCRDFRMQGSILTAVCRTSHGRGERLTALNIARCVGDIGNNGHLICNGGQHATPLPPGSG